MGILLVVFIAGTNSIPVSAEKVETADFNKQKPIFGLNFICREADLGFARIINLDILDFTVIFAPTAIVALTAILAHNVTGLVNNPDRDVEINPEESAV